MRIRNGAGTSAAAAALSAPLEARNAGVGRAEPPRLIDAVAGDPDGGDSSFGAGDTLTLRFQLPTDLGARAGGKRFVDSLFEIEPSPGDEYEGAWSDSSTFVIDVRSASRQLSAYEASYQTTPTVLRNETLICPSFDRLGAMSGAPVSQRLDDANREIVVALNGGDFVRTGETFKYYADPYDVTGLAPVSGGTTAGGTAVTLYTGVGITAIAEALKVNKGLTSLHLERNG